MAIVEIINLTKSFKDIEVIHNTSFYFMCQGAKKGKESLKVRRVRLKESYW